LVGLLCGHRAVRANLKECILDTGVRRPVKGAKIFAVLRGVLDAGMRVSHQEGVLPDEDRTSGAHIVGYAVGLKEKSPDAYRARFSGYLDRGLPPEQLREHFQMVKQNIRAGFGG
jgi:large subunit ribosomal protein L18